MGPTSDGAGAHGPEERTAARGQEKLKLGNGAPFVTGPLRRPPRRRPLAGFGTARKPAMQIATQLWLE
ncbi:MAG TPA: hypothetical protein VG013_23200 [Gemmataceae bacterium]|nr:hypothetical protein [Gemmataceae bacterium]